MLRHGCLLVRHSFRMQPRAYTSTFSSKCEPLNCSGAMYMGVPLSFVAVKYVFAGSCRNRVWSVSVVLCSVQATLLQLCEAWYFIYCWLCSSLRVHKF